MRQRLFEITNRPDGGARVAMGAGSMAERKLTFVVAEDEERMREYLARKTAELDPAPGMRRARRPTGKRPWSWWSATCPTC